MLLADGIHQPADSRDDAQGQQAQAHDEQRGGQEQQRVQPLPFQHPPGQVRLLGVEGIEGVKGQGQQKDIHKETLEPGRVGLALFLLLGHDGELRVAQGGKHHGADAQDRRSQGIEHHRAGVAHGQGPAGDEFQEGVGGAQHLADQGRQGQADDQAGGGHQQALQQIDAQNLMLPGAAALDDADLALLHAEDLPGHHEDEGHQQGIDGHLEDAQGDGDLGLRLHVGFQDVGKIVAVADAVDLLVLGPEGLGGLVQLRRPVDGDALVIHNDEPEAHDLAWKAAEVACEGGEGLLRHEQLVPVGAGGFIPIVVAAVGGVKDAHHLDAQGRAVRIGQLVHRVGLPQHQVHADKGLLAGKHLHDAVLPLLIQAAGEDLRMFFQAGKEAETHGFAAEIGPRFLRPDRSVREEQVAHQPAAGQAQLLRQPGGQSILLPESVKGGAARLDIGIQGAEQVGRGGITPVLHHVVRHGVRQHPLEGGVRIHGAAGGNGDQQDIADQQGGHQPLLMEHFPKDES